MFRQVHSLTIAVTAAALLAAGSVQAASAAATTGATGWSTTHTQGLDLDGALLGATPATQQLEVSAVLPLRNASSINGAIEDGQILTPQQVSAEFGPTTSTVSAVEQYLSSKGFTNLSVSGNRLLITGQATAAQAEQAFDTSISTFELHGQAVYANTLPAMVPSALASDVSAVLGLSDVPIALPELANDDTSGFTPKAVSKIYDDSSLSAKKTTTAIITSGNMTSTIENLRYAEQQWGYPKVPVKIVYDGPEGGIVENNPLTGDVEWDLDTQISTMVPTTVKELYVYDVATFTDPEVARGINMFVEQDKATALSASLGECDYIAFLDGAMLTTDEALAEGALQGQSMFASTGDNGYACPEVTSTGVPEGPPGVSWPADGEYTTAVGGTAVLATSEGEEQEEIAWSGGGGGISPWETAAPWTLQANAAGQTWEFTNQGGRGVPDVSALAAQETPYLVYSEHAQGSKPGAVAGTSVASPLTMGLWASVESAHKNDLGLAQYDFYKLYDKVNPAKIEEGSPTGPVYVPDPEPQPVPGFRDITVGTNGGCLAKAGYDYCTGIGSLQAAQLSEQL
jgi:pseudomonalisin